jgi:hypothetical protein
VFDGCLPSLPDAVRENPETHNGDPEFGDPSTSVVFQQLLGVCLGIDSEALGLEEELPAAVTAHLRDIADEPSALRRGETPCSFPGSIPGTGASTEAPTG